MMIADWVRRASLEILIKQGTRASLTQSAIADIITAHVPFAPDVAYMPVPRCATCAHWQCTSNVRGTRGTCMLTEWDEVDGQVHRTSRAVVACGGHEPGSGGLETTADFGCVQYQPRP